MKTIFQIVGFALAIAGIAFGFLHGVGSAQGPLVAADRVRFVVVESFDARHSGDLPGHIGRVGGLGQRAPNIALADDVFQEAGPVGKVTRIIWDRAKESLEIEFSPSATARVSIGAEVWLTIGNRPRGAAPATP